ncbi:MAG: hypothetical protein MZV70_38075 [Desulfobacterales bacterium]|nr:hypothetical protein [Desulfobacterales bacterium]
MSNMLFDGGCAFIMTSAERARDLTDRPVYLLGEGGVVTHFVFSQEPDVSRFGWARAGKAAFEMAGLKPQDMDIAEIYDSYPIYQMIGFEELGFAERGQGGEMFLQGDTWPGGKIPTTTNGGMLSQGHTGAGGACAHDGGDGPSADGESRRASGERCEIRRGNGCWRDLHGCPGYDSGDRDSVG